MVYYGWSLDYPQALVIIMCRNIDVTRGSPPLSNFDVGVWPT